MSEHEKPILTERGMPILTEETIKSIFDTYTRGGESWGQKLEDVKARLIKEQPHLVKFLEEQVSKYPIEMHMPILETFVAMYAVLEHQSNSDKISKSFRVNTQE